MLKHHAVGAMLILEANQTEPIQQSEARMTIDSGAKREAIVPHLVGSQSAVATAIKAGQRMREDQYTCLEVGKSVEMIYRCAGIFERELYRRPCASGRHLVATIDVAVEFA